jgi:hypothetical protein
MNLRVTTAALASILALASAADAATISSPAIFGSHDQNQATCVVLNTGTADVQITLTILTESNGLSGALTIRDTVDDGFGGSLRRPIRSAPLR